MSQTITYGTSREQLLEHAFTDIPLNVGDLKLRAVSASSFTLLTRTRNPMLVKGKPSDPESEEMDGGMFGAIVEFIWIHAAELDLVAAICTRADLQKHETEIRKMGFGVTMGQALLFLRRFQDAAERMSAGLTEVVAEDSSTPGKPPSIPAGSPPSSLPVVVPEIPSESDTFSGSCPLSEPLPIFTRPTLPPEPDAIGPSATSEPSNPTDTPPRFSERSETGG